jgi:hypothetical protein
MEAMDKEIKGDHCDKAILTDMALEHKLSEDDVLFA